MNEEGAQEASLLVKGQSRSSLASRTGVIFSVPMMAEDISFTPKLDLAWRHEFRDKLAPLTAELGGSAFTINSDAGQSENLVGSLGAPANSAEKRSQNGLAAGLGVDVTFGTRLNAYLRLASEWSTAADKALEARTGAELRF